MKLVYILFTYKWQCFHSCVLLLPFGAHKLSTLKLICFAVIPRHFPNHLVCSRDALNVLWYPQLVLFALLAKAAAVVPVKAKRTKIFTLDK